MVSKCILVSILILLFIFSTTIFAIDTAKVKILTQVQAWGQVVVAVILEYPTEIDPSNVSSTTYEVLANRIRSDLGGELAPRTITRVYTNNKPSLAGSAVPGRYVIIELNPNDVNAGTLYYDVQKGGFNFDYELEYTVNQKVNIKAVNGMVLPAGTMMGREKINLIVDEFKNYIYKNSEGKELPYSLFIPKNYDPQKQYPLVVFLHGAGERGYNNQVQLKANEGAIVWASDLVQATNPCFVLAPQCPQNAGWTDIWGGKPFEPSVYLEMVYDVILDLTKNYSIDKGRIYLTGLSMGGFGTWALAMVHPETFAALVPICGWGDTSKAYLIKDIPTWVFTAEDDPVVKVEGVRAIVKALQDLNAPIRYTEYEKGVVSPPLALMAHWSWVPTYKNQKMIEWLFSQRKK